MNTTTNTATPTQSWSDRAMAAALREWEGPPTDPLELAQPCPHCGELPEWERDGKFSARHRLNCCHTNDSARGYYGGQEIQAVIAWNKAAAIEQEVITWAQEEAEQEARRAEEDAWADANLPAAA